MTNTNSTCGIRRRFEQGKITVNHTKFLGYDKDEDGNLRIVWRCNRKYEVKGNKSCDSMHIDDGVLYQAFVSAFNAIVENKDYFMEKWKAEMESKNVLVRYKAGEFIKLFEEAEEIREFAVNLFLRLIEKMTVFEGHKIIMSLLDGSDIECEIE